MYATSMKHFITRNIICSCILVILLDISVILSIFGEIRPVVTEIFHFHFVEVVFRWKLFSCGTFLKFGLVT